MFDKKNLRLHGLMLRIPDEMSLPRLQSLSGEQRWMQAGLDELTHTPLAEWQEEYTRLFVNDCRQAAAPPYETHYRHETLFPFLDRDLQTLCRDAGLTIDRLPADHLATQLELAARLAASDDPCAIRWQTRLWQEHLQQWLPGFAADLCQHSRLLIYRLWGGQLTLLATHMQEQIAYA